jgi:hypothetical protein
MRKLLSIRNGGNSPVESWNFERREKPDVEKGLDLNQFGNRNRPLELEGQLDRGRQSF